MCDAINELHCLMVFHYHVVQYIIIIKAVTCLKSVYDLAIHDLCDEYMLFSLDVDIITNRAVALTCESGNFLQPPVSP